MVVQDAWGASCPPFRANELESLAFGTPHRGDASLVRLLSYGTRSQLLFQLLSYGSKTLNSIWFRAVFVNWKRREREAGLIQSRCILP